ncbi:TetR/AcrR family transcriptional regulator [Mycobacterium sp. M1]|uniref:TetR/AcrR family transcriptional regulator n=1 Tax=Mycolicibacter acidiphilus TaxID=2835306 RepID=A0ABS5RNI8_9MYCO|nr:TetR/AcrR family transcriptional regulator [Mycolicibacter acidiphilus]MBS9535876.1 TetR/AcrR family transcriptional regulator [Mycolicibacter acidiphilus]
MATRRGDKEARRRDILDAGWATLRENGLAGLQMREVARRSGVALGTVYLYFSNKESLYTALYAERMEQFLADLEPMRAAGLGPEEFFAQYATKYLATYADFGRVFNAFSTMGVDAEIDPVVLEKLVGVTTRLIQFMRSVLADYRIENPDQALIVLWSTVVGLAEHFTGPRHLYHDLSWDDTVRFATRTVIRGLASEQ